MHNIAVIGCGYWAEVVVKNIKQNKPITSPAANLDEAVKTIELTEGILKGLRE